MADKDFLLKIDREIREGIVNDSSEHDAELAKMAQGNREALLEVNEGGVIFGDEEERYG
jgi:hypothetical protein